jgi:hypothetical protein
MLLHRIAHRLGWNMGYVVSALDDRGTVWIGFKCARCGRIEGIHADYSQQPELSRFRR